MTTLETRGMVGTPNNGHVYLKFRNDRGAAEIRVGTKEFECIGHGNHPAKPM